MLTIFNGRQRTPRHSRPTIFMQVDVTLREHLHRFWNGKNANALTVFLALALHMDEDGWAFPSFETLKKDTGISRRETLTAALYHLTQSELDGQPMLHIYRRLDGGKYRGNVYHVFPGEGGEPPALAGHLVAWDLGSVMDEPETDDPSPFNQNQLNQNQSHAAPAATALAPVEVTVPPATSSKLRDAYCERCPTCGAMSGLQQHQDECVECGQPVIWHSSRLADQRRKTAQRQAADERAKHRREQETYLSPLCAEVLALARADSASQKHGATIHFNRETHEEQRLSDYERSLGTETVRRLMHQARDKAKGRGMIVALLRACEAYVPPNPRRGQTPNVYETHYD